MSFLLGSICGGVLLFLAGVLAISLAVASLLWITWGWWPSWEEAGLHARRPRMWLERWVWFRWIHPDCQYWVAHVRLDKGPIVVRGEAPEALYWSLTWYQGTQTRDSIDGDRVPVDEDGRYSIAIGAPATAQVQLGVPAGVRRAVLYLRIYQPASGSPSLPSVTQRGRVLVPGTTS